ncbi:hypothetical protein CEXT_530121 [Caerostris extrusa]|uniref:Uncharacterized protein n=1 Tax=Caerostris extrusa TaxID=172846 RepID=A0AAV4TL30_CAEEX|nr:hypothetical protein CEXT_530121 [Caerostris extrusa]
MEKSEMEQQRAKREKMKCIEYLEYEDEWHLPGDLPPGDGDTARHPPVPRDVEPVHHQGSCLGVLQTHKSS